jgi:hypothetical protein
MKKITPKKTIMFKNPKKGKIKLVLKTPGSSPLARRRTYEHSAATFKRLA